MSKILDVEELLPAYRSAFHHYFADVRNSPDPRERLFAQIAPWVRAQIRRYGDMWDGSIQFKAEDLSQTLQMLLWESIVEWDRDKALSPAFMVKPIGVIIRKTQAKIRRWYREERRRYLIERALIHDYDDEWVSLEEHIGGWQKEAEEAGTPKERRYARTVVGILSTIGDEFVQGPSQEHLDREFHESNRSDESMRVRAALRCGALTESDAASLATERIRESDPRTHNRLRQQRHRARRRFEKWAKSDEGRAVLAREGLVPKVDDLCWLLATASNPSRRIPQETLDALRRKIMALPGGSEALERLVNEGMMDWDWESYGDEPYGYFTWEDLGFPEDDDD